MAEYERDPASADAEYGANFRSDIAAFVDLAVLEACTADGVFELPPMSSASYVAFVDPSGVAYELSEKPKSDIYRDMLPLLNSRKVQLLDHRRLLSQLHGLERRTARGGRDSIDHGPGAHDDVANSVAGALLLVSANRPMVISDAALAWSSQPARGMQPTLRTFEGRFN
jgi:hypothetical protein